MSENEAASTTEALKSKHIEYRGVDPRNIEIVPGFNVREDFGDLEELMESIFENGLRVALIAKKKPKPDDEKWELIDGERRLRAIMLGLSRGKEMKHVAVQPFNGSQEERLIAMAITGTEQKQFTKLEQAELVRRLSISGYSVEEISKKLSKSLPTIYELVELSAAPKQIKDEVASGAISASAAAKVVKDNKDDEEKAVDIVKSAVQTAKEKAPEGKKIKKVVLADIPEYQKVSTDEKLKELIDHLKFEGIENDKVELLRNLATNIKTLSVEKLTFFFQ